MVNEETLVKLDVLVHALLVVVVKQTKITIKVALIKDSMETLARLLITEGIPFDTFTFTDSLIGHWHMLWHIYVIFDVHLILD